MSHVKNDNLSKFDSVVDDVWESAEGKLAYPCYVGLLSHVRELGQLSDQTLDACDDIRRRGKIVLCDGGENFVQFMERGFSVPYSHER